MAATEDLRLPLGVQRKPLLRPSWHAEDEHGSCARMTQASGRVGARCAPLLVAWAILTLVPARPPSRLDLQAAHSGRALAASRGRRCSSAGRLCPSSACPASRSMLAVRPLARQVEASQGTREQVPKRHWKRGWTLRVHLARVHLLRIRAACAENAQSVVRGLHCESTLGESCRHLRVHIQSHQL